MARTSRSRERYWRSKSGDKPMGHASKRAVERDRDRKSQKHRGRRFDA
jgi:hypothetical protein